MSKLLSEEGFVWYQLPAILFAFLIFIGSSIPARDFPSLGIFEYDKAIHFTLFFVLGLLTYRATRFQNRFPFLSKYASGMSLLLAVIYGAIDEIHQFLVPGRSPDAFDWLADSSGALLCFLLLFLWHRSAKGKGY